MDVHIWELDDHQIHATIQIDVDPEREKEYLRKWKTMTIVDGLNNLVFIPEFSLKKEGDFYSMIGLNNSNLGYYEQLKVNCQVLCDKAGSHQLFLSHSVNKNLNGLLYSDFVLVENSLFISHGRFVTVIGIANPS